MNLTNKDYWNMEWSEYNRHVRNELKRYARSFVKKDLGHKFDKDYDKIIIKMIDCYKYVICIFIEGDKRYIISASMEDYGFEYREWKELGEVDKEILIGRLLFPNNDL